MLSKLSGENKIPFTTNIQYEDKEIELLLYMDYLQKDL